MIAEPRQGDGPRSSSSRGTQRGQSLLEKIVKNYSHHYRTLNPQDRGCIVETTMLVMEHLSGPGMSAFLSFDRRTQSYHKPDASLILKRIDKLFVKEIGLTIDHEYENCWAHSSSIPPRSFQKGTPHVIFPNRYKAPRRSSCSPLKAKKVISNQHHPPLDRATAEKRNDKSQRLQLGSNASNALLDVLDDPNDVAPQGRPQTLSHLDAHQ